MRGGITNLFRLGCLDCFHFMGSWMDVGVLSLLFGGIAFVEKKEKETENASS